MIHPLIRLAQASSDPSLRARYLSLYSHHSLTSDITSCHACTLRPTCEHPSPPVLPAVTDSQSPCYLTILTESPGFTSTAENMLRSVLARYVGIAWDRVARLSFTYCRPSDGRRPTELESSTCQHQFLARSLAAIRSQVVLVMSESQTPFPIDGRFSLPFGQGFEHEGRLFYSVQHPQTVLSIPGLRPAWEAELEWVGRLLHGVFVTAAKRIFTRDSTWPYLIDRLTEGLAQDLRLDHRLAFASRVTGEIGCDPVAVERIRQSDLFGYTISELQEQAKAGKKA